MGITCIVNHASIWPHDHGILSNGIISVIYVDVDECADGTNECDQNCHNNDGSYTCSCNAGFTLNNDELFCDGTISILYYVY